MITGTPLTQDQLAQLRRLLAERCGLRIGDADHPTVQAALAGLMARTGADSFDAFLEQAGGLRDRLAQAMISRETAWFREPECLRALVGEVLPEMEERLACGQDGRIRILSAGCSTGQEPYSLVMALLASLVGRGLGDRLPAHYEIVGADLSPAAIFLAVAGRYEARGVHAEGVAADYVARFFDGSGRVLEIKDALRRSVRFRQHNLPDPVLGLAGGPFDVVLLRHVLEYYTEPHRQEILAAVHAGMAPEGWLFLGAGETLPARQPFRAVQVQGCACYRRR